MLAEDRNYHVEVGSSSGGVLVSLKPNVEDCGRYPNDYNSFVSLHEVASCYFVGAIRVLKLTNETFRL